MKREKDLVAGDNTGTLNEKLPDEPVFTPPHLPKLRLY